MTEEIYIDGVNVAGCRHCMYKGFKAFPQCRLELDSFATACTQHKECEYKQLKRLEQENKELKKDVQLFKCLDTFGENECHCACRCLGNEFCEDADKKINTYRSALEEIRAKVNQSYQMADRHIVLNIINEVLNDK